MTQEDKIPPERPFETQASDLENANRIALSPENRAVSSSRAPARSGKSWLRQLIRPGSWQFWGAIVVLISGSMGFLAVALLLKMPGLPNCPAIFWPTASASLRLYCAQVAAKKRTVDDLLEAIALVRKLPEDHPLRPEINRNVEDWSQEILTLANETFNAGDLSGAIATARRIPTDTAAYDRVEKQIEQWQSIWTRAEEIYQRAEELLRQNNLPKAFREAVRLLTVGNTYWETTKYDEMVNAISIVRQEGGKLAKARSLARKGGLKNLLSAIEIAESIRPNDYLYKEAQKTIADLGRKMLNLADAQLKQEDLDKALTIVDKIPDSAKLKQEAKDFVEIAGARSKAWEGTVAGLQEAIARAEKLGPERPLYSKAQSLILNWEQEIGDVVRLARARSLAKGGDVASLRGAIEEAGLVPFNNPRGREARQQIRNWKRQIEITEDRPYLDGAEQLAASGNVQAIKAAIQEAQKISRGRALYKDAQRKVKQWKTQVERIEDQPLLDEARRLARIGNLASAIANAERIRPGRTLYKEAQAEAKKWRADIQGRQYFQAANQIARQSVTPASLLSAIQTAQRVPADSSFRPRAQDNINRWSQQILSVAEDQANYDMLGAIAIAQTIPTGTAAYTAAQSQIKTWQAQLAPPEPTVQPAVQPPAQPTAQPAVQQEQTTTPPTVQSP